MGAPTDADRIITVARHARDRATFAVVFLLLFVISYSEDIVAAVLEATGRDHVTGWIIGLVGFDAAALLVASLLKRTIGRGEHGRPQRWGPWWTAGAAVLCVDVLLILLPPEHPLWIDIACSIAMAVLMGLLMMLALNADPLTLVSGTRRSAEPDDWAKVRAVVPLMIGTLVAYTAATAFDDFFDLETVRTLDPQIAAEVAAMPVAERLAASATLCEGAVSPAFFELVVTVIPLLLLAIGVEFNFFRRALAEPAQRAAAAATVAVMCVGLALALGTLPWAHTGCGGVITYWHEYLAFVVAVQGIATGLATLLWLLASSPRDNRLQDNGNG